MRCDGAESRESKDKNCVDAAEMRGGAQQRSSHRLRPNHRQTSICSFCLALARVLTCAFGCQIWHQTYNERSYEVISQTLSMGWMSKDSQQTASSLLIFLWLQTYIVGGCSSWQKHVVTFTMKFYVMCLKNRIKYTYMVYYWAIVFEQL